jgi:hypothetical protein
LLLAPLLLGGCGTGAKSGNAAEPAPAGDPWVLVNKGEPTAAPAAGGKFGPRTPYPSGFLPLAAAAATPTPTPAGSATCAPVGGNAMNFASVEPGTTSAAVTFYNKGGNTLVEYRVTAIVQDLQNGEQRDVGWTVLTPGAGCGLLTATVTGLETQTDYVFSVDAVDKRLGKDGTTSETVARSQVVRTN